MNHLDDDLILSAMDETDLKKNGNSGEKRMKNGNVFGWKRWASIAAAFAVILSAVLISASLMSRSSGATIALDVNPSIEIEIDEDERVDEVRALNADAETVLEGLKLEGVDLNTAVKAIIGSMLTNGYLSTSQNSILVSIDADSSKTAAALKEKITGEIGTLLGGQNIEASVITQNFDKNGSESGKAEENKISEAKSTLISKIIASGITEANGAPYTYETLAKLNVNELKLILDSKSQEVGGISSSGNASLGDRITREEAISTALERAGLTETDVTRLKVEIDYDDDVRALVYEVEFIYGENEYDYEILASDGRILEEEIEPKDNDGVDDNVTAPENVISREAALELAYTDAKVAASEVRRPKIELDREGSLYVYEIEFKVGTMEYEYEINAKTGEIIAREVEPID